MPSPSDLRTGLALLGVMPAHLDAIHAAPTLQAATDRLAALRADVAPKYKARVKELHPDVTGDDPKRTAQFRAVQDAKDWLDGLTLEAVRPMAHEPAPPRATTDPLYGRSPVEGLAAALKGGLRRGGLRARDLFSGTGTRHTIVLDGLDDPDADLLDLDDDLEGELKK